MTNVLTDMQLLGTFPLMDQKTQTQTEHSVTIPLINNIVQVIILWEPASQYFHLYLHIHYYGSLTDLRRYFVSQNIFAKYSNYDHLQMQAEVWGILKSCTGSS